MRLAHLWCFCPAALLFCSFKTDAQPITDRFETNLTSYSETRCQKAGIFCKHDQYCCQRPEFNTYRCCSTSNEPRPTSRSNHNYNRGRFGRGYGPSFWNIWYFWFAIILILATCFTSCNHWRRQHYSSQWNLRGLGALAAPIRAHVGAPRQMTTAGGESRLVIPVTMYQVPADALLRMMSEHEHAMQHRQLLAQPPSYSEVAAKPELYPSGTEGSQIADSTVQPPAYDTLSVRSQGVENSTTLRENVQENGSSSVETGQNV